MSDYITIPLSKQGKHKGKYEAIVSVCDSDMKDLRWNVTPGKNTFYATGRTAGKPRTPIKMHRIILERMLGRPLEKGEVPDHRDGNGLNNTRENLRLVVGKQNNWNAQKRKDNVSGYKGVNYFKTRNKWRATIQVNGRQKHLGYFDNPEDAHKAYCEAAIEHYGEYARFE